MRMVRLELHARSDAQIRMPAPTSPKRIDPLVTPPIVRAAAARILFAMAKARLICAVLLAIPLIVFGGNYFVHLFEVPPPEQASAGTELLDAIRDGGLMLPIAASHVLIGAMLLVPRARFAGALLQLPMSVGILAFHVTMLPEGNIIAAVMLLLNLVVLADGKRVAELLGSDA